MIYLFIEQVNVVKGMKLYEDVFTDSELSKLIDFVNEYRAAGQNGELSGEFDGSVLRFYYYYYYLIIQLFTNFMPCAIILENNGVVLHICM